MERIGNAGWFMTDEEHEKFLAVLDLLSGFYEKTTITGGYDKVNLPYDNGPIEINKPQCPNCPWKNPGDWTWRPWQAPWYGIPPEQVPTDYKVGDGEWWKHQPYCTSTTEDNPNAVKDTKTDELVDRLKDM